MKMRTIFTLLAIVAVAVSSSFTNSENEPKLKKLFNGKNLDGWKTPEGNIWWSAKNGILTAKSGPDKKGSILWTENDYKDFIIQADFKFGKGTIDSGIFIRCEEQQIQIG